VPLYHLFLSVAYRAAALAFCCLSYDQSIICFPLVTIVSRAQSYGYETMFTLYSLEKVGLLRKKVYLSSFADLLQKEREFLFKTKKKKQSKCSS
jgi:hypothetical protein